MASEYLERVKDYVSGFNPIMQQECMRHVKALRTEQPKFSYKWIYKALTYKKYEDWRQYGFGLLYVKSYRAQINKLIEKEEEEEQNLSWDWFDEDDDSSSNVSCSSTNVISSVSKPKVTSFDFEEEFRAPIGFIPEPEPQPIKIDYTPTQPTYVYLPNKCVPWEDIDWDNAGMVAKVKKLPSMNAAAIEYAIYSGLIED